MDWKISKQPETEILKELQSNLNIPEFICTLLLQRNIDSLESAQKYFRPNLNLIAKDISNKISQYLHKPPKKIILIINNINIFQNQKPLEKVFIKNLINNIELKNLNILLTENKNSISQNNNLRILDIKIEKIIYKDEEEIKINWMIRNKEGKV